MNIRLSYTAKVLAMVGILLSLTACGFSLRGIEQPLFEREIIGLNFEPEASNLARNLEYELGLLGATNIKAKVGLESGDQVPGVPMIRLENYELKTISLLGTLREVTLELKVDAVYLSVDGVRTVKPLSAIQSYQYDAASINTERQQETLIIDQLGVQLARQVARLAPYYLGSSGVQARR